MANIRMIFRRQSCHFISYQFPFYSAFVIMKKNFSIMFRIICDGSDGNDGPVEINFPEPSQSTVDTVNGVCKDNVAVFTDIGNGEMALKSYNRPQGLSARYGSGIKAFIGLFNARNNALKKEYSYWNWDCGPLESFGLNEWGSVRVHREAKCRRGDQGIFQQFKKTDNQKIFGPQETEVDKIYGTRSRS